MWAAISSGIQFVMGIFGFGSKIQDEKNTPGELVQKEANDSQAQDSKIAKETNEARTTDDTNLRNDL